MNRLWLFVLACITCACYGAPSAPPAANATPGTSLPPSLGANQKVTISFTNYNIASAGIGKDATELLLREFSEKFPNVTVEARPVPSDQITSKVQAEVVGGNPPDLVQIIVRDLDFAVRDLRAKSLDRIVPPDEFRAYTGGEHPLHPRALKLTELGGRARSIRPYHRSRSVSWIRPSWSGCARSSELLRLRGRFSSCIILQLSDRCQP